MLRKSGLRQKNGFHIKNVSISCICQTGKHTVVNGRDDGIKYGSYKLNSDYFYVSENSVVMI